MIEAIKFLNIVSSAGLATAAFLAAGQATGSGVGILGIVGMIFVLGFAAAVKMAREVR